MKPIRNYVFCYGCRKTKILFESKSKADNFIRYNSKEIKEENGKAPVRSYYCELCSGFHITSNPSIKEGEDKDYNDYLRIKKIEAYSKEVSEIKKKSKALCERLEKVHFLLNFGMIAEAEDLLDICNLDLSELAEFNFKGGGKLITYSKRVEKMTNLLQVVKDFVKSKDEVHDIATYLSNHHVEESAESTLKNVSIILRINDYLTQLDILVNEGNRNEFVLRRNECYQLLETLTGIGKKAIVTKYANILSAKEETFQVHIQDCIFPTSSKVPISNVIKEQHDEGYFDDTTYKNTILELINRLEKIKLCFEKKQYDDCDTLVDVGYIILDDLGTYDKNTELLKGQLDMWKDKLAHID